MTASSATQIGQNEPLAPDAIQIPVHTANAITPPPACWSARRCRCERRSSEFGALLTLSHLGEDGQIGEQALELGVRLGAVGSLDALVELVVGEPSRGVVVADLLGGLLAILI